VLSAFLILWLYFVSRYRKICVEGDASSWVVTLSEDRKPVEEKLKNGKKNCMMIDASM
jgi:hypothetical protein